MALLFQVDEATQLGDGVWRARLSPSEVRLLDPRAEGIGGVTILLLTDAPKFDAATQHLSFDPSKAKLLNAGTSDIAILIGGATTSTKELGAKSGGAAPLSSGDSRFINAIPAHLCDLGTKLLSEVRRKYPGDLTYYEASGKYVDAPDNFWTIRPQPRDGSFRITVRGRPASFDGSGTLKIKPDMPGYSSFKIERVAQIEEFMQVLGQVRRK